MTESWLYLETLVKYCDHLPLQFALTCFACLDRAQKANDTEEGKVLGSSDVTVALSLLEAKRSQSVSSCVRLSEALPGTQSVPLLLHTVGALLPGLSYSSCSHRLSGTVTLSHVPISVPGLLPLPLALALFVRTPIPRTCLTIALPLSSSNYQQLLICC